jgi:outer membrane protein TolC
MAWLIAAVPLVAAAQSAPRHMDLQACVDYGLAHSLALANSGIDRDLAIVRREAVDGLYEPRLDSEISYTDSNVRDGSSFFVQDRRITAGTLALSQGYRSGTRASLTLGHNHIEAAGDVAAFLAEPYSSSLTLSVSQSILRNAFGELDRARTAVADEALLAAQHAHARQRRVLAAGIAGDYWRLYSARRNYEAARDSLDRAAALVATYRRREADGLIDATDLLATEALEAQRRVDVLSISNGMAHAADALRLRIQLPPAEWAEVRFTFPDERAMRGMAARPVQVADPRVAALAQREDLKALQRLESLAEATVQVRQSELKHDLQVFGQVARGGSDDGFAESWSMDSGGWGVGVQLGMGWGRTAERKALEEAHLEWLRARNSRRALEEAIALEAGMAARDVASGLKQIGETATARDLQQRKLALEQEKFEQGRSAVNWLLQYEEDYSRSRMVHNLAVADFQAALARYRLALGEMP